MIYNLNQYVLDNTTLNLALNGLDPIATDTEMLLTQTGGDPGEKAIKLDTLVQFISRSSSRTGSYRLIQIVYDLLRNRFGIILPEATVEGTVYPAVRTAKIVPLQIPGYIGTNENGLHEWSVNFQITTGGN